MKREIVEITWVYTMEVYYNSMGLPLSVLLLIGYHKWNILIILIHNLIFLFNLAYRMIGSVTETEDIMQDCF